MKPATALCGRKGEKRFSGAGVLTIAESLLYFAGKGALFYRAVRTHQPEYTIRTKGKENTQNEQD